jgi:Leucine-rich repeat (LRR) protein
MAIDFSNFKELEEIDIPWNNNLKFKGADSLKYLILRKYGKEIFELELPQSIEFLELIQGKLKSIQGIEQYQNLKALVLYAQPKMEEYTAIGELKNLEFLHLHGGHLKDVAFITKLKNLKWLVLENCKEIETLKPLMDLDNLIGVQLVGTTKPLDGDKSIRDIKNKYEYHYPYKSVGQRLYKEL